MACGFEVPKQILKDQLSFDIEAVADPGGDYSHSRISVSDTF